MSIYKMLIQNRFREYKRLIQNLLAPFVALIIVLGVSVYQICVYLLPVIMKMETINHRSLNILILLFLVYGFYRGILRVQPVFTLKPMTIYLFSEKRCRKLIAVKYIAILVKHSIICIMLSSCIAGLRIDFDVLYVFSILFLYLELIFWLSWIEYHSSRQKKMWLGIWVLLSGCFVLSNYFYVILFLEVVVICIMLIYALFLMDYDWTAYEEEMRFQERLLTAQNYNNTVLLNQYSKEKRLRNLSSSNKKSFLLLRYPLMWKAKTSITRLNREFIFAGIIVFLITFAIYKVPAFWRIPFFEQPEIRYMFLVLGILMAFQLSIQSMLKQLDNMMEKEKDGLFIPRSNGQILCQFTVFPSFIISIILVILAVVLESEWINVVIADLILLGLIGVLFYLELTRKEFENILCNKHLYFMHFISGGKIANIQRYFFPSVMRYKNQTNSKD